jgi:hypothetical protein
LVPPAAQGAPPPQLQELQAKMSNEKAETQAKLMEAQAKTTEAQAAAAETKEKITSGALKPKPDSAAPAAPEQVDTPVDQALAQAKLIDAKSKSREVGVREREVAVHELEAKTEDRNRDLDREDKLKEAAIGLAGEVIRVPTTEAGGQVGVSGVGKKASRIIKDVDKGLK